MKNVIKSGSMVRFDFNNEGTIAYGTVIWVDKDKANVDYKNPITREHEVKPLPLDTLTLIGNERYTNS